MTRFHDIIPAMAARLVPALGLGAASVLLAAVGVAAMSFAGAPADPVNVAQAVAVAPASRATTASTLAARAVPSSSAAARSASPKPSTSKPRPFAPAQSSTATGLTSSDFYAQAVLAAINQARASQQLTPLIWSSRLRLSAREHNRAMSASNTLAHQVGSEDTLGQRETAAGVQWSFAAENIGWTTIRSLAGALAIQASMLDESAPADSHRRNILSRDARAVGIDVLLDPGHNRLWLTEDFANAG